jgi:hypothetical protein
MPWKGTLNMTASTLPTPTTACSLCGLPAPYCPCDRRDLFTTPNMPMRARHFAVSPDLRLVELEADDDDTDPEPDDTLTPLAAAA